MARFFHQLSAVCLKACLKVIPVFSFACHIPVNIPHHNLLGIIQYKCHDQYQASVEEGLPSTQIHQGLLCTPWVLNETWYITSRLWRTEGSALTLYNPNIPICPGWREGAHWWSHKDVVRHLSRACTSTILTHLSCCCFCSLKAIGCCSSLSSQKDIELIEANKSFTSNVFDLRRNL